MGPPFEQLRVWQISHELGLHVYRISKAFPDEEKYGLTAQLRRAATAVPTNIVEGNSRGHRREYIQFCRIAKSSAVEVKYLLRLARDLGYLSEAEYRSLFDRYEHLGALLHFMIRKLHKEPDRSKALAERRG